MLRYEPALVAELSTITVLGGRIYPLRGVNNPKKQGTPYLIYSSSDGMRTKDMGGYKTGKAVSAELHIVGPRYADTKDATRQVVDLLITFIGRKIGGTGPFIQELTYQAPVELYDEQPDLYRCVVEFDVYFEEV